MEVFSVNTTNTNKIKLKATLKQSIILDLFSFKSLKLMNVINIKNQTDIKEIPIVLNEVLLKNKIHEKINTEINDKYFT